MNLATLSAETWIKDFIIACRNAAAKKDLEVSQGIYEILKSITKSCQITAIKAKGPSCLLLFTHDDKRPDQEIVLYDAKNSDEVRSILDKKILVKDYFQITARIAVSYVSQMGNVPLSQEPTHKRPVMSWTRFIREGRNDFLLVVRNECFSEKPGEVVDNWLKESKETERLNSLADLKDKGVRVGTAIGGLWHPPIVLEGPPVLLFKSKIAELNYKRRKVLLYNNGIIAVVVSKKRWNYFETQRKIAIEILNEIVGTANLYDIRGISFTDDDLVSYDVRFDTMQIGGGFFSVEFTPRSLIARTHRSDFSPHSHRSLLIVRKEKMLEIVAVSKKATSSPKIKSYISTYLDAVTHYHLSEYKASFLLGWILIEKYIDDIWCELLENKKVGNKRYKKLTGILWSADDIIECLNLVGKVAKERYAELIQLKKLRNEILHSNKLVDSKDSDLALGLCKKIILEMIGTSKCGAVRGVC